MLEYIALGLGAAVGVAVHLYEKKLYKENERVCEENKRAFERLNSKLDNPENMSRLVAFLTKKN